jgi:hypothetical protein
MAMGNVLVYLTIGIPTLAVLIGILMNVVHFNSLESRFRNMETRISHFESRFDSRFTGVDARFNNLEVKFDTLIGKSSNSTIASPELKPSWTSASRCLPASCMVKLSQWCVPIE